MASVNAIWSAMRITPVLLRIIAEKMGLISMDIFLVMNVYWLFSWMAGRTWQARQVGKRPASKAAQMDIVKVIISILKSI